MTTYNSIRKHLPAFFFLVLSYSQVAYLDYGGALFDRFPAAVRAMAALCKLPFALRPGLSQHLCPPFYAICTAFQHTLTVPQSGRLYRPSSTCAPIRK
jgi:hypothetical protein